MHQQASDQEMTALWWVRRDLRLADNQALALALEQAATVVPVFVLDPTLLGSRHVGEKRLAFLLAGLHQLDRALRDRGSRLVVRRGDPADELNKLVQETRASAIVAEEDYSPYARLRDRAVAQRLPLQLVGGLSVHHPTAVLKADGMPYTVFTPYSRAWKALPAPLLGSVLPAPERLPSVPPLDSQSIPDHPVLPDSVPFRPGEGEAHRRLEAFAGWPGSPIDRYDESRNRVDLVGTSGLSPYLRFGMLSPRQAVVSALSVWQAARGDEAKQGAETWLNELIWREFYLSILYHFPHVLQMSFRADLRHIQWNDSPQDLDAWRHGRTGYPLVDAAMRQLHQTGWMHNRARMVVASFLVKDLLIDWRLGEAWFMQHLIDGDPAANNGGWQWSAGTGTDAAPYFRIMSPIAQSRYDPDGDYVRRWLPELARVPSPYVHEPWKMPLELQRQTGCLIGRDYPAPIVDHAWARERTLAVYAAAKAESRRSNR